MDSFLLLRRLVAAIVFKGQTVSDYWWSRRTIFLTSRAATLLPEGTKLELEIGADLETSSSTNHTAAVSQPTG